MKKSNKKGKKVWPIILISSSVAIGLALLTSARSTQPPPQCTVQSCSISDISLFGIWNCNNQPLGSMFRVHNNDTAVCLATDFYARTKITDYITGATLGISNIVQVTLNPGEVSVQLYFYTSGLPMGVPTYRVNVYYEVSRTLSPFVVDCSLLHGDFLVTCL